MTQLYGDHSAVLGLLALPTWLGLGFVCLGKQVDKLEMTLLHVCA